MLSNNLILCHPLLQLRSIFPTLRVYSNELTIHIRLPKYWSFGFSISPSNESDQVRSVAQSCPTLCDLMNCSTPGLPVPHQLPEFTQTHVHRVSDAIEPSHPLLSPSSSAPNPPRIRVFSNESTLCMRWPNTGVLASASFLPKNS